MQLWSVKKVVKNAFVCSICGKSDTYEYIMLNYKIITYLDKKKQVWVKELDHSLNVDYTMNNNILNIYALENIVMGNYSIDCLIVTPRDLIKLTLTETHIETKKLKNFRLTICENIFFYNLHFF